jgi:DnaK suppressor protein
MEKKKLDYFKNILIEEMKVLQGEAGKTVTEMTTEALSFPDPTDRATQESDRNFELRIRDRERKLINKIKDALDRIESNEFGICDDCGEEIGEARLKARPVTTQCIDCKMVAEEKERRV